MAVDRTRFASGMVVLSSEGKEVGKVKEIRESDFLLDRAVAPDIYLPYTTANNINGEAVELNISVAQVDDLGWADTGDDQTTTIRAPQS